MPLPFKLGDHEKACAPTPETVLRLLQEFLRPLYSHVVSSARLSCFLYIPAAICRDGLAPAPQVLRSRVAPSARKQRSRLTSGRIARPTSTVEDPSEDSDPFGAPQADS